MPSNVRLLKITLMAINHGAERRSREQWLFNSSVWFHIVFLCNDLYFKALLL